MTVGSIDELPQRNGTVTYVGISVALWSETVGYEQSTRSCWHYWGASAGVHAVDTLIIVP